MIETKEAKLAQLFDIKGKILSANNHGHGHINSTLRIVTETENRKHYYILQKINKNVFKNPPEVMENFLNVTNYLTKMIRANGGDERRETLNIKLTADGKPYVIDDDGEYWRVMRFVTETVCYDKVERPEQFYDCAVAFGDFQYLLRDYPADTLHETIKNFHNTPDRYRQLEEAVKKDVCGRCAEAAADIDFALSRFEFANTLEIAYKEGKLPLRVTHNDTKLNNILFDKNTGKALCVIDLDTIMPGYSVNDFGDAIRFGATTAAEDEKDLSKVNFDMELYELYVKGFIEGVKGGLTATELELLPVGAMMMTYECGIRFLTDYLSGDTYFKTTYPEHNLDRARNQFKLLSDMEAKKDEMLAVVKKYSNI